MYDFLYINNYNSLYKILSIRLIDCENDIDLLEECFYDNIFKYELFKSNKLYIINTLLDLLKHDVNQKEIESPYSLYKYRFVLTNLEEILVKNKKIFTLFNLNIYRHICDYNGLVN